VDVQGPEVVRPYTRKHQVTFPVAVDGADVFGQAFGLKAIPVSFLVDEVGIVRLRGGAPTDGFLAEVERILAEPWSEVRAVLPRLDAARSVPELEARVKSNPDDWRSTLALAERYAETKRESEAHGLFREIARREPKESAVFFTWGMVLLRSGERETALEKLKTARDLDPNNWRVRKQIWAIEHPEKFYSGPSPDYGWQKEELARERNPSGSK